MATKTVPVARLSTDGMSIVLEFPYDAALIERVKAIKGRRYHPENRTWTVPYTPDNVQAVKELGFELDESLDETKRLPEIKLPELKRKLFPFQEVGVRFLESRGGSALIADEMGLGKTIQVLSWLALHRELRPAVVVCPASVKWNWRREIEMTFPDDEPVQVLSGHDAAPVAGRGIIIVNYDVLGSWLPELAKLRPKVLVLDECHYIKNNKALRTKAARALAKASERVICLSGTPVVNRPIEFYNAIRIVSKGKLFPNFWDYARRYCDAYHNGYGWNFKGSSNEGELHRILTSTIMIRRTKQEVLQDLPPKLRSFVPLELTNRDEYRKAEIAYLSWMLEQGKDASRVNHLAKIEALRQLACAGKLPDALEWIEDFLDSGKKLVVFAHHRSVVGAVYEKFRHCAVKVDGSTSLADRDSAVRSFNGDDRVRLFVGNIKAAGVGISLTAASSVAFLELPWSPGELVQAEDRCHRIGQKDCVNVYYLLTVGTIEEWMANLLDEKARTLSAVLDGRDDDAESLISELISHYSESLMEKYSGEISGGQQ